MLTLNQVNKALKNLGHDVELVRGQDYFWLSGPDAEHAERQGIYVAKINHQTLDQWIEDCLEIINDSKQRKPQE